ncbi:MAG: hypothetical protein WC442_01655 [Candidatus Omnitrophota bacterium]
MKKVFLLIKSSQSIDALTRLRSLGVVHVENENLPQGIELNEINEKLNLIGQARSILSGINRKVILPKKAVKSEDWLTACHHLIDLSKRYGQLKEYAVSLSLAIDFWENWGDFEPEQIRTLQEKNIQFKFYQIPKEQIKNLPREIVLKEISRAGQVLNCLVVSFGHIELGFKEIELPKLSLSQMKRRLKEDTKIMQDVEDEIAAHLVFQEKLILAEDNFLSQKDFYSVLTGMGQAGGLLYLKGYIPIEAEEALIKQARYNGWGMLTLEPKEDDLVPTLTRNPKWIALIKPLLKLLELVPGYKEIDISPLFIVFFSLFFGILIGDAGYGLIYFLLNFWLYKKIGNKVKDKSAFFLFYILSLCAIIWGILTATFFGQEWLSKLGVRPLVPALNNTNFIQAFCFFVGALHLSIAHGWKAVLKSPALNALADIGWMCVIWAAFFLAKNLILGDNFPSFANWLIIGGLVLVLFFTNPQKNILKAIGEGLGTIALSLVNNFTDVVSYIRLFAVGLATVAIADAFNGMAAGIIKQGDILTLLAAALVVVLGHALNIILGPMSVLVHGVRLNVLEFSGHANVTWSGFAYKPFSKTKS